MSDNKSFTSGNIYTLSELFSDRHKIIVPDLQRDYCWGNDSHTEEKKDLVTDFVNNLISHFSVNAQHNVLNLGLIYGYESPKDFIQLCDGQQRVTTLFLLIGSLNKRIPNNWLKQYLISDFEYNQDDKEPYLQYSIRESSLYFISDLVCHYFINEKEDTEYAKTIDDIKKSSWFFNEYNTDPSIQSMLKAISKIEEILTDQTEQWCKNFGEYLVKDLTFMYYDMVDRKNGEETFVVINTTGEPLSPTQNLKPLIIDANSSYKNIPSRWEEIETWFWKNRQGENDTADAGFNEFLRWVTILNTDNTDKIKKMLAKGRYSFPKDSITFEEIYNIYKTTKFLFEEWDKQAEKLQKSLLSPEPNNETNGLKCISQINCFVLLPLIAYCTTWKIQDPKDLGLCRLYHFLQNLTRLANVSKAVNELVGDAIYIAKNYSDIVDVLNDNKISTTILTEEEKGKLQIIKTANNERANVENAFWRTQKHNIWNGQIWALIQWAGGTKNFSLETFESYETIFNRVFCGECDGNIDIVRRALLTRDLKNYPRVFKGHTNLSFGWEWSDWKVLINDNTDKFKSFFDEFNGKPDPGTKAICEKMINEYLENKSTNKTEYTDFIEYPYLMSYCEEKNIQSNSEQGILLLKKKRTSAVYISVACKHLYEYLKKNNVEGDWHISDEDYGGIVLKHKKHDIAIYIYNHIQEPDKSYWTINVSCNEDYCKKIDKGSNTSEYTAVLDFISNLQFPL